MIIQSNELVFSAGPGSRRTAVIVPLHNYEQLIEQTLDSVAAQTFRDCVLIVVDDCSSDSSLLVVRDWMQRQSSDMSFRLYENLANARLAITRNSGVERADGAEFCFFLDADNLLYPQCLEKHVDALVSRPDAVAAHSIVEKFGSETGLFGCNAFDKERLRDGNYIDAMAMFRRDFLIEIGGYRNIQHGWEDYDLWLRLCDYGETVIHIPEILSRYRVHGSSMLRTQTNVGRNIRELHKTMAALHPWLQLER
jgi:glycosyltransferase involved in cell wall biosynthesis